MEEILAAYTERTPNPDNSAERVSFGTSGHRGTSLVGSFNRHHILAVTNGMDSSSPNRHLRAKMVSEQSTIVKMRRSPSHWLLTAGRVIGLVIWSRN